MNSAYLFPASPLSLLCTYTVLNTLYSYPRYCQHSLIMDSPQLLTKPPGQTTPLNGSYKQHTRASSVSSTTKHSHRWPLRVMDDNSPTHPSACGNNETKYAKDLGTPDSLYTTSPSLYHSGSHHQPTRPRRYPVDAVYTGRLKPVTYEEGHQNYEQRSGNLRTYRDTTSEIISLYAASNPQGYAQMAPNGLLDTSREYSISNVYAKHVAAQRPSTAIQASASMGGLQRSRSPVPYPARLRRPGVQAASPAVTEDGMMDYNGIADLGRPSQVCMTCLVWLLILTVEIEDGAYSI